MFRWSIGLLGAAVAIFAIPSAYEGPVLVDVSAGHAIAVADAVAIAPLLVGTSLLYLGLWRERRHLLDRARERPALAMLGTFVAGTGLGLLLASAFSSWFWWWAVGAALFGASLIGAAAMLSQPRDRTGL
jgi:hypothetical protein